MATQFEARSSPAPKGQLQTDNEKRVGSWKLDSHHEFLQKRENYTMNKTFAFLFMTEPTQDL